jgi:hypothetical protein
MTDGTPATSLTLGSSVTEFLVIRDVGAGPEGPVRLPLDIAAAQIAATLGVTAIIANVKDKDLATPPVSPATGDKYIVAASPTGAWVGHVNEVAEWGGSAWIFSNPEDVYIVYVTDEARLYGYNQTATAWQLEEVSFQRTTIHRTTGTPLNSLGIDGDWAIDPATYIIYGPKGDTVVGTWPAGSMTAQAAAVATAADRVQTGLDAAATAADRVQTGLDRTQCDADVVAADNAKNTAIAAAEAAGVDYIENTKADATANLATYAANSIIMVLADESLGGERTLYRKESGVLVYKLTLSPGMLFDHKNRPQVPSRLLGNHTAGLTLYRALHDIAGGTRKYFTMMVIGDSVATYNWITFHMRFLEVLASHLQSQPVYAYSMNLLPDWGQSESQYGAVSLPLYAGTGTLNWKTDYDASYDGTNVELAPGQVFISGWGSSGTGNGNNTHADEIKLFFVREPGAGQVKVSVATGSLSPVAGSGSWRNPTALETVSPPLTGSELIVDCNGTFGLAVAKLSVALGTTATAKWAVKIENVAGAGNVRVLSPMFFVKSAPAINMYRLAQASCDFSDISSTAHPVMSALIGELAPDVIILENADQRDSWEYALPIIETARQASGLTKLPAVVMVGAPYYENVTLHDYPTLSNRIAFQKDWANTHLGWDMIDMLSMSGGYQEAAAIGEASDGIHYAVDMVKWCTMRWCLERGYWPLRMRLPGGEASTENIISPLKKVGLLVTSEVLREAFVMPDVHETGYCTYTFDNTSSATSARGAGSSTLDLATGATAGATSVARINDSTPPWQPNNATFSTKPRSAAFSSSIRIGTSTTNGVFRYAMRGDVVIAGAYKGDLTGEAAGFEIVANQLNGVCWDAGAKVSVPLLAMTTGRWYAVEAVLRYNTVSSVRGKCEWYVDGSLIGSSNFAHATSWLGIRAEITNGADAANYAVRMKPFKILSSYY